MSDPGGKVRGRIGGIMQKLPTAAWVCLTVAFLGILATFAVLSVTGSNPTEFRSFLNTALSLAALLLTGGTLAFSAKAQQQTNSALDERITTAVTDALDVQRADDTAPGGEFRR